MQTRNFLSISLIVCASLSGGAALAQSLLTDAQRLGQEVAAPGVGLMATGPWSRNNGLPAERIEGTVTTESYLMPDGGLSTLELLRRMRVELEAEGFVTGYVCETIDCGGFDFRFAIPVMAEPEMHVDLGNFRYLTAQRPVVEGKETRILLISRAPRQLYVQITKILPLAVGAAATARAAETASKAEEDARTTKGPMLDGSGELALPAPDEPKLPLAPTGDGIVAALLAQGGVALDDLAFATGSAELVTGDYASLDELGAWLLANPNVTVAFVGHTDATGGLAGNVALSKRRAESVRSWIRDKFKLPPGQIVAEGVGYLAPRAPNDTPEGQAKNRRVEVVVTSTP